MDLLHKFLNTVFLLLTLTTILIFMPPFLFLRYLFSLKRSIYSENVAGKVVLITGASSGIGEHIAYEYARRGARLALVARREDRLRAVADKARELGSPEVIVLRADVSKIEESKQFVDEVVNHFGRCKSMICFRFSMAFCANILECICLSVCVVVGGIYSKVDHLVNNAGIIRVDFFEDSTQFNDIASIMDINFWGSVYGTHYAVPHLRKSKGKIVVISSTATWLGAPKLSFYNASKAAQATFFETLRAEFGPDIGITTVTPGVIDSEMTQGQFLPEVQMPWMPVEPTEGVPKKLWTALARETCT